MRMQSFLIFLKTFSAIVSDLNLTENRCKKHNKIKIREIKQQREGSHFNSK